MIGTSAGIINKRPEQNKDRFLSCKNSQKKPAFILLWKCDTGIL